MNKSIGYITGEEFMELAAVQGAKVLSAPKSLHRRIGKVNILEVPDIEKYVEEDEIIISTLFPFKDNLEEFIRLLRKLAKRNITGFAIKPRRFIQTIPEEVITIAGELDMLLIELPDDTVFADVVYEAVQKISNKSVDLFLQIQKRTEVLLLKMNQSRDILETMQCIEEELGIPLFLVDSMNKSFLTPGAKERLGDLDYDVCKKIRSKASDGKMSQLLLRNRQVKMYTMEVHDRNLSSMLLNLITGEPISGVEAGILENVAQMLFIQVRNYHIIREQARKYKANFLIDCLKGILVYQQDILKYAADADIQIDSQSKYGVAILNKEEWRPMREQQMKFLMRQWEKKFLVVTLEDNIVLILNEKQLEHLEELFERYFLQQQIPAENICIYVSDGDEITSLAKEYQQALLIKRIAGLCNLKRAVIRYRDLGSYTVLSLLPMEHPEILRMEERFVKPIREYDTAHNTKLLETLSTYFGTEQNLRETAACMYTHYNTISYRMEKIRELLALPKWDAEIQLQLQIALKLWNMNFKDRNEAAR